LPIRASGKELARHAVIREDDLLRYTLTDGLRKGEW
jgi:hypothetical protein